MVTIVADFASSHLAVSASYFNFVSNSKDMRILYLDTEAASASGVDTRYLQSQVKNWDEGDP